MEDEDKVVDLLRGLSGKGAPSAPPPSASPPSEQAEEVSGEGITIKSLRSLGAGDQKGALGTPQRPKPEPDAPSFSEEAYNVGSKILEENIAPAVGWFPDLASGAPGTRASRALEGLSRRGPAAPEPLQDPFLGTEAIRRGMRNLGISAEDRRPQTATGKMLAGAIGEGIEAPLFGGPVGLLLQGLGRGTRLAKFGANLAKPLPNVITGAAGGAGGELLAQGVKEKEEGPAHTLGRVLGGMAPGVVPRLRPTTNLRPTRAETAAAQAAQKGQPAPSTVLQAYKDLNLYPTAAEIPGTTGPFLRMMQKSVLPNTWGGGTVTAIDKELRQQNIAKVKDDIAKAMGAPSSKRMAGEEAQIALENAYKGEKQALGIEYQNIIGRHATAAGLPKDTLHALDNPVTAATTRESVEAATPKEFRDLQKLILSQKGHMSVGDLRAQRTKFGKMLDGSIQTDVDQAQIKQIYGALSDDIEYLVKGRSPADFKKLKEIDARTHANESKMEQHFKAMLQSGKIKASGERMYYILTNSASEGTGKGNFEKLKTVWNELPKPVQGELAATILSRMGATDAAKPLESFSIVNFIKEYRGISEDAKNLLWRNNPTQGKAIKDLETVINNMEQTVPRYTKPGGVWNPSSHTGWWAGGQVAYGLYHMLDWSQLLLNIGGPAVAQFIMTNPTGVKALAKSLQAGRAATDAALRNFITLQSLPQLSTPAQPKVPAESPRP